MEPTQISHIAVAHALQFTLRLTASSSALAIDENWYFLVRNQFFCPLKFLQRQVLAAGYAAPGIFTPGADIQQNRAGDSLEIRYPLIDIRAAQSVKKSHGAHPLYSRARI